VRAYFLYIRHSSTLILGVLVALTCVSLALTTRRDGLNLWPDFVTGLSQSSVYTGVLAAGFCAWEAARWVGPASARMSGAVRIPAVARIIHFVGVITPTVLGFMASVAILAVYGLATGTYGAPSLPWLLVLVCAIVAASALGYAVGVVGGRRWYVAPLGAILFFVLYVLVQVLPLPYGVRSLYPVILNMDSEFVRHIATTMWGQIAAFLAASAALLLAVGGGWRRSSSKQFGIAIAVIGIIGIGGVSLVQSTNGQYVTGFNSRDFACRGDIPEICLNKGYVSAMPALTRQFEALNEKSAGTALSATLVEQNVEGIGDEPSANARSVYIEGISDSDLSFAISRYVGKYGGGAACNLASVDIEQSDIERFFAVSIVDTWLSGYDAAGYANKGNSEMPGRAEFERFMNLTPAEGNQWLRQNFTAYSQCKLELADLP
jgi:hypothetical protein